MATDQQTPEKKTYREMVQDIYNILDKAYDRVGALRDCADQGEKQIFNDTRGLLGDLMRAWNRFDNNLPDNRADMIIGNWVKRLQ